MGRGFRGFGGFSQVAGGKVKQLQQFMPAYSGATNPNF